MNSEDYNEEYNNYHEKYDLKECFVKRDIHEAERKGFFDGKRVGYIEGKMDGFDSGKILWFNMGMAIGTNNATNDIIKEMLKNNYDVKTISNIVKKSIWDVKNIKKELA